MILVSIVSIPANDTPFKQAEEFANYYGLPIVNVDYAMNLGIEKGEFTGARNGRVLKHLPKI